MKFKEKGSMIILSTVTAGLVFFFMLFSPLIASADNSAPVDEDWLQETVGGMNIDQVELVENAEDYGLPLLYLENYLANILPDLAEPGRYLIDSDSRPEGLFQVEDFEQLEKQFDEQPENWEEGDEWVWEFADEERYVEIVLTAEMIDYVEEPGIPMVSRIIFDLEYAAPHLDITGTVRVRDDIDDVDMILEMENRQANITSISTDINFDLINRIEEDLRFSGVLDLPGASIEGEHRFLFTERPRDLPRVQPLYLDEYILSGFFSSSNFALEGDLWLCTESVVMNGYTVID